MNKCSVFGFFFFSVLIIFGISSDFWELITEQNIKLHSLFFPSINEAF